MSSIRPVRRAARAALPLVLLGTGALSALASPSAQAVKPVTQNVVVSGADASAVRRAVESAGGTVTRDLPIIGGVAARVPATALGALRRSAGVRAVTHDATGHLLGIDPALGYDVAGDEGSLFNIARVTNARAAWGANWTGKGVDVALIDSGVSPVQGLTSGNLMHGPDLSFESQSPDQAHLDTYGHGTHMASIISGRDAVDTGGNYGKADSHKFVGVAPDSRLISIKVASNDGATDVSQVIAAIDWVVEHAHDTGFNIRVLNLSYGTDSTQDPTVDPLCFAVENAWRAGIVVVVASGNDGTNRARLANPAQDPLILAVGADDPMNTEGVDNDVVPSWAQLGEAKRRVDVIAPGVHVLGLRDPGSRIDQTYPSAVVGTRFFRGSGTSQSAAVVSGLSALYLQKYPAATADQVKKAFMVTAAVPNSLKASGSTIGVVDVARALGTRPTATQAPTGATGTGSLELSRGTVHVTDGTSTLTGEQDIFGHAWDGTTWAPATSTGTAWDGGNWNGNAWTGNTWSGNTWSGNTWSGNMWSGNTWSGNQWSGNQWSGNTWSGNTWSGNAWTGNAWTGNQWSGNQWSGSSWSSQVWE
jgi:serine protease AprX